MRSISTTDIVLASALKQHGYDLDGITKIGNRGTFEFSEVDEQFLQDYDLGKIQVEPIGFNNQIKTLTTAVRRLV